MVEPDPLSLPLERVLSPADAKRVREAFGYATVGELIDHLPRRYARRGELGGLDQLEHGAHITIVGRVVDLSSRRMRNRPGTITEAVVSDGRHRVTLVWFNQKFRAAQLHVGDVGLFSGQARRTGASTFQLAHPDLELLEDAPPGTEDAARWQQKPLPIYPATAKLPSWAMASMLEKALPKVPHLPDPVPAELRAERGDVEFDQAVRQAHSPATPQELEIARESLRFTEAFVLQTALARERARRADQAATPRPRRPDGFLDRFSEQTRFTLTPDQESVGETLAHDLAADVPMHRLLQGEVGSGKTLVAVRAMLQVAETGGQSAVLAPTEVLARQHLRSITQELGPELAAQLQPTLVIGAQTKRERTAALLKVMTGDARIIVGTHALLGDTVEFHDLGLVVIDEQHRFGVDQREQLRRKGKQSPHMLVLTATPIPRTVAMTVFGDLDVSTLRTMPRGRAGINTVVVALAEHPGWLSRVWERIAEEVAQGRQAFIVCPAIEPGEPDEGVEPDPADEQRPLASVAEILELTRAQPTLRDLRIEPLHGRLSSEEKDETMLAFAQGEVDVLVATTVIEVGVDVPNASVMAVLDADRFGISQLHQLRGRIGRGEHAGLCLLVTYAAAGSVARERVDAVAETLDGFALAERDLELRREGDVLGSRQSGGTSSLRVLQVSRDAEVIAAAREAAVQVLAKDPTLTAHPALAQRLDALSARERDHLGMG